MADMARQEFFDTKMKMVPDLKEVDYSRIYLHCRIHCVIYVACEVSFITIPHVCASPAVPNQITF